MEKKLNTLICFFFIIEIRGITVLNKLFVKFNSGLQRKVSQNKKKAVWVSEVKKKSKIKRGSSAMTANVMECPNCLRLEESKIKLIRSTSLELEDFGSLYGGKSEKASSEKKGKAPKAQKSEPKNDVSLSREPQRLERKQSLKMLDEMLNKNNNNNNKDVSPKVEEKKTPKRVEKQEEKEEKKEKEEKIGTDEKIKTEEPTTGMSVSERMAAFKQSISAVDESQEKKMAELKRERGFQKVEMSSDKASVAGLFEQRLKKHKEGASAIDSVKETESGFSLKAALKEGDVDGHKAQEIMTSMNIFQPAEKKPERGNATPQTDGNIPNANANANTNASPNANVPEKLEVLNMNNSAIMNKMSQTEKENMETLICNGIVNNKDLKVVQMCNANVDDLFFIKILDTLAQNQTSVTEVWFENNSIGDTGMQRLATFIRNDKQITVMKFYSNKKTISTPVLEELCNAIMANETLIKFVFDGFRFQQHKDTLEKALKRNHNLLRQKKAQNK
ncbi:hypothetical protein RFI_11099 [Reticulomyxa filosa]|uniref:Uncharacterized protein n=1 Tax=Reticulomyxa filosa TaxID=46433 RepID=X6NJE5_RETFI|nr:hypothetical protein RFI_11099 [Reticulomyxa filosa]|eukprot:ETO26038.1 hypothetical protein RFI_11099 [Reticulomyxa filosa]